MHPSAHVLLLVSGARVCLCAFADPGYLFFDFCSHGPCLRSDRPSLALSFAVPGSVTFSSSTSLQSRGLAYDPLAIGLESRVAASASRAFTSP